jgi:hypothetical protein
MQQSVPGRSAKLKWFFLISLVVTFAFTLFMRNYLHPLTSADIIRFEMAKTPDKATGILLEWESAGKLDAAIAGVYLDYVFIVLYTIMIALGCRFLSSVSGNELLAQTGKLFGLLIFLAAIFDVVENKAMLGSLREGVSMENVDLTYKMAISKFSIVLMSLFFMAICLVSWLAGLLLRKKEVSNIKREMSILRNLSQRD